MEIYWSVINIEKEVLESLKTLVKNQKDLIAEIKEVKKLNFDIKDLKATQEELKIELEAVNKKLDEILIVIKKCDKN